MTGLLLYVLLEAMTGSSRLAPCPRTPNCVCSDASDEQHAIDPFRIEGDPQVAWKALLALLEAEPRTEFVTEEEDYVHVTSKTRVFRFIDDVEFELRSEDGVIAVRSASRVGRSDLGVNRRRVESIRKRLGEAGYVESKPRPD